MDKYSIFYHCSNCYYTCQVWIPKKAEAPMYFECPNCGRHELNKSDKKFNPVSVTKYDMVSEFELVRR